MDTSERQKIETEEELKHKREAFRKQDEDWTKKKKEIAENVVRRTLLMDQAGIKRSSEVMRLEELRKAYTAMQEISDEDNNV